MKKRLLVADDSLTIQKVIRLALKEDGYDIHAVSDGAEVMQHLSLIQPDVVLIDVDLPGGSAFDVKKSVNEDPQLQHIAFVLMSSAFEKVDEAKTALLGFHGRLTKPFDPSNLRSTLSSVLQNTPAPTRSMPPPPPSQSFGSIDMNLDDEKTKSLQLDDPLWNESSEQSDIRQLTESTVKMSGGFDELGGWNIQENAKSNIPPLPEVFPDDETTDIPIGQYNQLNQINQASSNDFDFPTTPPPAPPSGLPSFQSPDVEAMVAKMVREQLPDIAEKVIRQEIRKLLENMV